VPFLNEHLQQEAFLLLFLEYILKNYETP